MDSQEKKRWLSRYRSICRQIQSKLEEKARLRSLETKITPTLSDMPKGGGNNDKIAVMTERIDEIDRQISEELDRLARTRAEIEAAIQGVEGGAYREVLERRYIHGEKWEQIAIDMDYDYRWVLRLHGKALNNISIEDKEATKSHYQVC